MTEVTEPRYSKGSSGYKHIGTQDLKIKILEESGGQEFYGYEIQKRLKRKGIDIEFGRLYKILTSMLRESLLQSRWERSSKGPKRKLFKIDENVQKELDKALLAAIDLVREHYNDYVVNLAPWINPIVVLSGMLTQRLLKNSSVAYVVARQGPTEQVILEAIRKRVRDCKVISIGPKSKDLGFQSGNETSFDGEYDNIPLKDQSVDLLVIMGVPESQKLRRSMDEWRRILKVEGDLAMVAPNVLLTVQKDPATLDDFVEKWAYNIITKNTPADMNSIQALFEEGFRIVEKKNLLNLTVLLALERQTLS